MKTEINELEFFTHISWEDIEYPPITHEFYAPSALFKTTIILNQIIEQMSSALNSCNNGSDHAIANWLLYFDFLEKQVRQIRYMIINNGYEEAEDNELPF
ncbi:MAG: hypothetical protein ABFD82_07845 [Syntrophaceae bacterium]